jgi:glucokinase
VTTYIAVDLGGTNIRAAHYKSNGELIARAKRSTHAKDGNEIVLDRVIEMIREVMPPIASEAKVIAIGAPGPLNPFSGIVLRAPNLPGWVDFPLREIIEERLKIRCVIGNDANLAAMGEWKFGAGRGHADVLYLTISTGIGGGVISGGKLILGKSGMATELGHVVVAPDGAVCGCGQRGHLEAMASGPAIAKTAQARLKTHAGSTSAIINLVNGDIDRVTAAHVGEAAHAGDPVAINLIAEAGTFIGRAIADFCHIFNPSIVILGGGVAINCGDLLLEPARAAMRSRVMSSIYLRDCEIVQAQLGDDVGLLGALALAVETFGE